MPVPTNVQPEKNIWIAAGDGDLERVRELIEVHSMSPNVPDDNTYTPMHAAASYGHMNVLEYLISRGGDVNVADDDGDTPLYVVENVETARFLVEHGAVVARQNAEGLSPVQYLEEEKLPAVAAYLEGVRVQTTATGGANTNTITTTRTRSVAMDLPEHPGPSQHAQNVVTENLTALLLQDVQDVMQHAEAEGREVPDEELRRIVGRAVIDGVITGYGMGTELEGAEEEEEGEQGRGHGNGGSSGAAKRPRMEGG